MNRSDYISPVLRTFAFSVEGGFGTSGQNFEVVEWSWGDEE